MFRKAARMQASEPSFDAGAGALSENLGGLQGPVFYRRRSGLAVFSSRMSLQRRT
ncbi:hypothetical protein HMPREF9413_0004 [Paenibacillus sp. HGF7]|nr:hypothetical protein HMPREF9413_0004 [Paenibacillus sp. HGF7]